MAGSAPDLNEIRSRMSIAAATHWSAAKFALVLRPMALFCGFLRGAEHRVVRVVDKGLVAFGRHRLGVVDRALDVVAPHLARQFGEHLDAVAVGIDNVEAVRHAVVDAALEFDALHAQPSQMLQPRLAVRQGESRCG